MVVAALSPRASLGGVGLTSAVAVHEVGEAPHVAQADGVVEAGHDELHWAGPGAAVVLRRRCYVRHLEQAGKHINVNIFENSTRRGG